MNADLHTVIPGLIARRWFSASRKTTLFAALGGAFPDLVSAVEHLCYWAGIIEYKWVWRNFAHFYDQGALILMFAGGVIGLVVAAIKEDLWPALAGFLFVFGYGLHILVDILWHPEGGGWYWWGFWLDMIIRLSIVAWFVIGWVRCKCNLKSYLSQL